MYRMAKTKPETLCNISLKNCCKALDIATCLCYNYVRTERKEVKAMAKRRRKKPAKHERKSSLADFIEAVAAGVVAAGIWYLIQRLFNG